MQALILAAGKSTRTYPLTIARPKPLLKVANKTLLEHNLDNLNNIVNEVIIVVGYKKNLIRKHIGNKHKNLKIKYVEQKQQHGTGHAVSVAEPYVKDRFILMAADDIYSKKDIKNSIKYRYSILVNKTSKWRGFGVVVEKNDVLVDFVEKPEGFVSDLVNTAYYVLDKKIFECLSQIKKSKRNEYEFPDSLKLLSKEQDVYCVKAKQWLPIAYPWDLLGANKAIIGSKSIIGKGSKIYGIVKNSSIGNNCIIRGNIENSIIMDNTIIDKDSVVEESVIGENIYFKGKVIAKNNVFSIIKNKRIKVSRLGAIIGDNSKLINVDVKAGCKIWPNRLIKNKSVGHDVL